MSGFGPATLDLFRRRREMTIETSRGPGAPVHRAVIWIVVDERDRVLVRSWRGSTGRWYREAIANPSCAILVGGDAIPVRAEPARDPERVEACSAALAAKYGTRTASAWSMLRPEILDTTVELLPR